MNQQKRRRFEEIRNRFIATPFRPEDQLLDIETNEPLENEANKSVDRKNKPQKAHHPDYAYHFSLTGQRPQNFLKAGKIEDQIKGNVKMQKVVQLKSNLVETSATPPKYAKVDLQNFDLSSLNMKFDVILIDPPLEEYVKRHPYGDMHCWSWDQIAQLPIPVIASSPSFLFLWAGGSAESLKKGRQLLRHWNYRRVEEIVWVKKNQTSKSNPSVDYDSVFVHTKEHCLVGAKGNLLRSDNHFVHCNIDTDVICTEEIDPDDTSKPKDIYGIIERLCLGKRRLELFGTDKNIRPGWLTLGLGLSGSNFFNLSSFASKFDGHRGHLVPFSEEVEHLRPQSPPRQNQ